MLYETVLELIINFLISPFEYVFCRFRDEYDDMIDLNHDKLIKEI